MLELNLVTLKKITIERTSLKQIAILIALTVAIIAISLSGCTKTSDDSAIDPRRGVSIDEESDEPFNPTKTDFGTYHALIIGINNYTVWPPLQFAESDAADIRERLINHYSFKDQNVSFLTNDSATRANILSTLTGLLRNLKENDNLLIYYAGHGQIDELTGSGYWIPVEGGLSEESSWIRFSTLIDNLTAVNAKAKNILIITDSCYGGALTRGGPPAPGSPSPFQNRDQYIKQLSDKAKQSSRQVMVSGGYHEVPDKSLFAELLKGALDSNTETLVDAEYMFYKYIFPSIRESIPDQEPHMSRMSSEQNQRGQFVFIRSDIKPAPNTDVTPEQPIESNPDETSVVAASTSTPSSTPVPQLGKLIVRSNVSNDQVYLDEEYVGSTRLDLQVEPGRHSIRVAKNGYEEQRQTVSIEPEKTATLVFNLELIPLPPPRLLTFNANPTQALAKQNVTLSWRTEDAATATINNKPVPLSGSLSVNPSETTAYLLKATNINGVSTTSELQVEITQAVNISELSASKLTIIAGDTTTISWAAENATSTTLNKSEVASKGMHTFKPNETTTYTLIASNSSHQTTQKQLTITVKPKVVDKPIKVPIGIAQVIKLPIRNIATALPAIHTSNSVTIKQTYSADLDIKEANMSRTSTKSDFMFEAKTATKRFIKPLNNTVIALMGSSEAPGYQECKSAKLSKDSINTRNLRKGSFVCLKTSSGHIAQMQILAPVDASPGTLKIKYTTWK